MISIARIPIICIHFLYLHTCNNKISFHIANANSKNIFWLLFNLNSNLLSIFIFFPPFQLPVVIESQVFVSKVSPLSVLGFEILRNTSSVPREQIEHLKNLSQIKRQSLINKNKVLQSFKFKKSLLLLFQLSLHYRIWVISSFFTSRIRIKEVSFNADPDLDPKHRVSFLYRIPICLLYFYGS